MKTVLVTGASGFVGQHFCQTRNDQFDIRVISLQNTHVDDIDFHGIEIVLHLAGIAHRMEKTDDKLYYDVNYELTKKLAIASHRAGVKHFIFMSTTKVYGDEHQFLTEETLCTPSDAYGKSKFMAENELLKITSTDFNVAIIRPPLIYGPNVKGNMQKLVNLIKTKKYLPLGGISNKRSLIGIDNLLSVIDQIIEQKAKGIFLVQDQKAISTTELIEQLAQASGRNIRLFALPLLFRQILKWMKPGIYQRIFDSFEVDDTNTRINLGYTPPYTTFEGIQKMINSY